MLTIVTLCEPSLLLISALVLLPSLSWLVSVTSKLSLNFSMQTPLLF